jgi:hypothetical protein
VAAFLLLDALRRMDAYGFLALLPALAGARG